MIKKTVSIGIPAYNEEITIQTLIHSILLQKEDTFTIMELIIISDGSSDLTVDKIKAIKDKRIKLIEGKERFGKSRRVNEILTLFKGEYLFLMDADITIKDMNLFSKIFLNVDLRKAGLVGLNVTPIRGTNLFERSLNYSIEIQQNIRKSWNNGRNYLAFRGALLCLNGDFARKIRLPEKLINNDAYFYFEALHQGYKPEYLSNAIVYYKSPSSFRDHLKQSSRFQISRYELSKYVEIPIHEYSIPKMILIRVVCKYMLLHPVLFFYYISINFFAKLKKEKRIQSRWSVASSTKSTAE